MPMSSLLGVETAMTAVRAMEHAGSYDSSLRTSLSSQADEGCDRILNEDEDLADLLQILDEECSKFREWLDEAERRSQVSDFDAQILKQASKEVKGVEGSAEGGAFKTEQQVIQVIEEPQEYQEAEGELDRVRNENENLVNLLQILDEEFSEFRKWLDEAERRSQLLDLEAQTLKEAPKEASKELEGVEGSTEERGFRTELQALHFIEESQEYQEAVEELDRIRKENEDLVNLVQVLREECSELRKKSDETERRSQRLQSESEILEQALKVAIEAKNSAEERAFTYEKQALQFQECEETGEAEVQMNTSEESGALIQPIQPIQENTKQQVNVKSWVLFGGSVILTSIAAVSLCTSWRRH